MYNCPEKKIIAGNLSRQYSAPRTQLSWRGLELRIHEFGSESLCWCFVQKLTNISDVKGSYNTPAWLQCMFYFLWMVTFLEHKPDDSNLIISYAVWKARITRGLEKYSTRVRMRFGCSFFDFVYIRLVHIPLQLNKKRYMDSVDMLGMSML